MSAPRSELMRSILQRVATGPELSRDISREEAREGMRLVLEQAVDPVQAGVFLIALRMKRETDEENLGLLEAIRAATLRATAPVDDVLDLGDPYDGYNRTLPASPFLPPVLAACGVATVSHGVHSMGPKYGVTHRQVLAAAGLPVDLSPEEAARRLGDARIGWAYVDQKDFSPKLYALSALRTLIVKRPAITTIEVLAGPVRGAKRTHLATGFVHKPYPRIYAMLARHAGFDSALIVRGTEGGVIPSLSQTGRVIRYVGAGEEAPVEFKPADFGIEQALRAPRLPGSGEEETEAPFDAEAAARAAAEAGLAALGGAPGATRDALVCGAAVCLWHLGRHSTLREAADAARAALDKGAARARLDQAK